MSSNCPLPSSDAARNLIDGKKGAVGEFVLSTGLRSVLIAPGLMLVGIKPLKALVGSLASSLLISTFVVTYMAAKKPGRQQLMGVPRHHLRAARRR